MKITTKAGMEIDLTAEELRHFKLDNADDINNFITTLENKKTLGFEKKE